MLVRDLYPKNTRKFAQSTVSSEENHKVKVNENFKFILTFSSFRFLLLGESCIEMTWSSWSVCWLSSGLLYVGIVGSVESFLGITCSAIASFAEVVLLFGVFSSISKSTDGWSDVSFSGILAADSSIFLGGNWKRKGVNYWLETKFTSFLQVF